MALPRIAPGGETPRDVLALACDDVTRETLRQVAVQLGWPLNRVRDGGLVAAIAHLQSNPAPAVLLVDVSDSEDVLAGMDALAEVCEPHTRVVAIGATNDVRLYRELIGLGVSDYLVKPVSAEVLAEALSEAEARERPGGPKSATCRTIAVVGARGGVGATAVATSLGWAAAHERHTRTVLLDLDLQFGAAALALDVEPGRGLRELLANPARIDSLLIGSALASVGDKFRVLAAEEPLETELSLRGDGLEALLAALAQDNQTVVLDVPRRLDALGRAALARADVAVIVTDLSLPGMRDSHRLLGLLGHLRTGETLVVANRIGGVAGEVPQAEFERGAGRKLDATLIHDAKIAAAAAEQARPLLAVAGQAAPLGAELRRLAGRALGGAEAKAPAAAGSWLQKILGK